MYKSGDIYQVLKVQSSKPDSVSLDSGISPPAENIKKERFKRYEEKLKGPKGHLYDYEFVRRAHAVLLDADVSVRKKKGEKYVEEDKVAFFS